MPSMIVAAFLLAVREGLKPQTSIPIIRLKPEGELRLRAPNLEDVGKTDMCIGPGPRIAMLDRERLRFYLFDLRGRLVAPVRKIADAATLDDAYFVTIGMNPTGWALVTRFLTTTGKAASVPAGIVFDRSGRHALSGVEGRAWTTFGLFDARSRFIQQLPGGPPGKGDKFPHWVAPGPDDDAAVLEVDFVEDHGELQEPRTPFDYVTMVSPQGTPRKTFAVPSRDLYHAIAYDGSTVLLAYRNELRAYTPTGKTLWRSPIAAGKEYNEIWLLKHRLYALDEHERILVFQMPSGHDGSLSARSHGQPRPLSTKK